LRFKGQSSGEGREGEINCELCI